VGLDSSIFMMMLVFMVLFVVAFMFSSIALFKVSFLSLVDLLLFTNKGLD